MGRKHPHVESSSRPWDHSTFPMGESSSHPTAAAKPMTAAPAIVRNPPGGTQRPGLI